MDSAPDGHEAKAPFDPHARFVSREGIAYQDFARYLIGEPDPEDRGNALVARYQREGHSTAFRAVFRKAYDAKLAEAKAANADNVFADNVDAWRAHNAANNAGVRAAHFGEASDTWKAQEAKRREAAHEQAHIVGFTYATDPFRPPL
jgi:hypothetical protein